MAPVKSRFYSWGPSLPPTLLSLDSNSKTSRSFPTWNWQPRSKSKCVMRKRKLWYREKGYSWQDGTSTQSVWEEGTNRRNSPYQPPKVIWYHHFVLALFLSQGGLPFASLFILWLLNSRGLEPTICEPSSACKSNPFHSAPFYQSPGLDSHKFKNNYSISLRETTDNSKQATTFTPEQLCFAEALKHVQAQSPPHILGKPVP